jgi:hypothetical protein
MDGNVVAVESMTLGVYGLPGVVPHAVQGFYAKSLSGTDGSWLWSFRHITGEFRGSLDSTFGSVAYRPGYLAFTSWQLETEVYKAPWLATVCDNLAPALATPPDARACVFTPI